MLRSAVRRLPRPLVAGIGLAADIPTIAGEIGVRLPGAAIGAVLGARSAYLEFARRGAEVLGDGEPSEADRVDEADPPAATSPLTGSAAARAAAAARRTAAAAESAADFVSDIAEGDLTPFTRGRSKFDDVEEIVVPGIGVDAAPEDDGPDLAEIIPPDLARAVEDKKDAESTPPVSRAELPIENYDGLSLASLRARMSRLDVVDLEILRDYESAHAGRLPVLSMLERRLTKLTAQSESWADPR